MINKKTIEAILGLPDVPVTANEMASRLAVTFFPPTKPSTNEANFSKKLHDKLIELNVEVVPFEDALFDLTFWQKIKIVAKAVALNIKIVFSRMGVGDASLADLGLPFSMSLGKKIRRGIAVIATGEGVTGNLPMDLTTSFKENPVITIIDRPEEVDEQSGYIEHMEAALKQFAWHMTNLVISVTDKQWTIYSFNGSYPTYDLAAGFTDGVMNNLIPKISAQVTPPRLSEFEIKENSFDPGSRQYVTAIKDLVDGGALLDKSGLYPRRKNIKDLYFRNNLYRWIGNIHLDKRSGMSYGFVARQLPTELSELILLDEFKKLNIEAEPITDALYSLDGQFYLSIGLVGQEYAIKLPEVYVLTSKSGADKSKLDIGTDIIKMGLVNGVMKLETAIGSDMNNDYRPSFDTKVILAHILGNAIIASVLEFIRPGNSFSKMISKEGIGLAHWHGYVKDGDFPGGFIIHGEANLPVSCSSPQSGIYALKGKFEILDKLAGSGADFNGDIQIEPHHGSNVNYGRLTDLAEYILANRNHFNLGG